VSPTGSPTLRRRRLAAELRELRQLADVNGVQVAKDLGWSTSKISRLENGQVVPSEADVRALVRRYDVDSEKAGLLLALAHEAAGKGWWEAYADILPEPLITYFGLEAGAEEIRCWQATVVPGLLQTRDYAMAVNSLYQPLEALSPGEMERRTRVRMRRQRRLVEDPEVRLAVVIDEAVLLRRYGDERVMREQLRHLIDLGELPNVTLQVLPFKGVHPADWSNFVLLRFPEVPGLGRLYRDVVYSETFDSHSLSEDETITYKYLVAFRRLTEVALDPERSRELIARHAGE
jgi:transcriptional regulator with XRE-family HTH domain